jgi:hypothetical protein
MVAAGFAILFNIPSLPVAVAMFLMVGPPLVIYAVSAETILQRNAPDHALGRVSATSRTAQRAASLSGEVGGSTLVASLGLVTTLDLAVGALVLGAASALLLPRKSDPAGPEPGPALTTPVER